MRFILNLILLLCVSLFAGLAHADIQRGIKNYQDILAGRKKVEQLSQVEAKEVVDVIRALERQRDKSSGSSSRSSYEIEVSHNDELFVINGEKFEAKTYCFNMEEGDRVIFLDGSALGVCVSATLVNLRTKQKCEVWCE